MSSSAFGCPYSDINMKKEVVLPDRLGGEKQITFVPVHFVQKTKRLCAEQEEEEVVNNKDSHEENRLGRLTVLCVYFISVTYMIYIYIY